jgi:hypothetical protein
MLEVFMKVSLYIWISRGVGTIEKDAVSRYMEFSKPLRAVKVGRKVVIEVELLDGAPFQYQVYAAAPRAEGEVRLLEFMMRVERHMLG